MKIRPLVAE